MIKNDTTTERVQVTAVRVAFDAVHPIKSFATRFSGWEIAADVELKTNYPIVEIGN